MSISAPTKPVPPVASTGTRRRWPRRRLPLWVAVPLWVVLAGLAVVAAMRIFAWDEYSPFVLANALTAFIYLPAWIVLVVAAVGRRFVLAGAALVIVVLQVVFLLPELTAAEPLPTWVRGSPTIRLMDANVYNENHSMAGYASQIKATDPTLLTMEEAVPGDEAQLQRSGALDHLPYRFSVGGDDPSSFLVASKYPLVDTHVVTFQRQFGGPFHGGPPGSFPGGPGSLRGGPSGPFGGGFPGQPLIVETTIALPSGNQALWVLHATAPYPRFFFAAWQGQLALINQQIRKRGTAGLLVVGDFNATWGNKGFRTILDNGLTDGAAARGHPFEMTWSQIEHPLPPFVRIDHILTGSRVAVTQIETGPGPGSDHRDLHATIAVER